jgi:hypothetical protein
MNAIREVSRCRRNLFKVRNGPFEKVARMQLRQAEIVAGSALHWQILTDAGMPNTRMQPIDLLGLR